MAESSLITQKFMLLFNQQLTLRIRSLAGSEVQTKISMA